MQNTGVIIRKLGSVRSLAGILLGTTLLVVLGYYGWRAIHKNEEASLHLMVYAFSTQEEAFTQSIFPAFERTWEGQTGEDLSIEGVFGASGILAGQINLGAPADVAVFSNESNVKWLRFGKLVSESTSFHPIGFTPLVIVTRPGNPLGIHDFSDLSQPELNLVHADPQSSGVGEWALLAEYGSAFMESRDHLQSERQVEEIWRNVCLLAPSARAGLTLFELGAGDAYITYEQDARLALERGTPLEIIVPPRTIVAEPVVIMVDKNLTLSERPVAQAFIQYLIGEEGQQMLGKHYLRPASMRLAPLPTLVEPFTVEDLGGWSLAYDELVEPLWLDKIAPQLHLASDLKLIDSGE